MNAPTDTPPWASTQVVAGLAREVDALRRQVRTLAGLPDQLDALARTVAQAVDDLAGAGRRREPVRPDSWIADHGDSEAATRWMTQLAAWVGEVYLHYPSAGRGLPACWLWHPEVIEELAWLHQAWQSAYSADTGTVAAVADWHDRYRPGVAHRIGLATRVCSLRAHTRPDRQPAHGAVPGLGSLEPLARWWAGPRDTPPPTPTQTDLDEADRRMKDPRR